MPHMEPLPFEAVPADIRERFEHLRETIGDSFGWEAGKHGA